MRTVNQALEKIRAAIGTLHAAAAEESDAQRAHTANRLDELFARVETRAELRNAVAQARLLYRGGMGSFQDVGSTLMAEAVDGLYAALSKARSPFLHR